MRRRDPDAAFAMAILSIYLRDAQQVGDDAQSF